MTLRIRTTADRFLRFSDRTDSHDHLGFFGFSGFSTPISRERARTRVRAHTRTCQAPHKTVETEKPKSGPVAVDNPVDSRHG